MTLHRLPDAQSRLTSADAPDAPSPECQEVLVNFWDYLDRSCSSELTERIDAHIASCVPCHRLREFQERFFESLAELKEQSSAPARLHERVRRAIDAERR